MVDLVAHAMKDMCWQMTTDLVKVTKDAIYSMNTYYRSCMYNESDINECFEQDPTHNCDQFCNNTDGGFSCSCEEGYVLINDSKCEGTYGNTSYFSLSS